MLYNANNITILFYLAYKTKICRCSKTFRKSIRLLKGSEGKCFNSIHTSFNNMSDVQIINC